MTDHNPVPFDFVPFSKQSPELRTPDEWEKEGRLLSGKIDYTLETLTPVHIVGQQTRQGNKNNYRITASKFHRNGAIPQIPGSSIKGMIRAFFEALANSWVNQATDEYPAEYKKRHIGFAALSKANADKKLDFGPVIPERFHPKVKDGKLDLASFLFGLVLEGDGDDKAYQSRLIFEDVVADSSMLDHDSVKIPDIPGSAFMGGPKPRMNNWWYFVPDSIKKRRVTARGMTRTSTDFIGKEYWGRKFYYHQYPENAIRWYDNKRNWPHSVKKRGQFVLNYYKYPVETVRKKSRMTGHIFFERIPEPFLKLILCALHPGENIRHKIGYGKAYGLGSVNIIIDRVLAGTSDGFLPEYQEYPLQTEFIKTLSPYLHENSLTWLALILSFDEFATKCQYTYPPFNPHNFQKVIDWDKYIQAPSDTIKVNKDMAEKVALSLFNVKRTIHFRIYQETTSAWDNILKRKP
ncbi:RAMP superfamily CRISPR-associated protein [Desulfococcaceae bacterium HSG9]|nr:RAMP superfamily CRISPR-associated protein [Desulfococcaceae bacterium HSG9]